MRDNSNKLAKIFVFLIALVIAGCSDTPNEPLVVEQTSDLSMPESMAQKSSPGFFRKRLKNLFSNPDTVWERMLSLYSLPEVNNERIDRELSYYLSHPDYIARVQERAAPYMHLILEEIEAKNLPGELALLPVVESAFIPEAYSRSAASGLWQFIPSTGRIYGLDQNEWYDGRRDIYASTIAATTFLKELGEHFNGDYFLALASYNYGKGNVTKAMSRNETLGMPSDYWSLDLPKETYDYVPRLLAVAKLFANADRYGIRLQNIPNKPYCEVVHIGSQLDLDKAAELANTPLSHMMKLNPCFKKGTTSPYGPHRLLIPSQHAENFKQKLASLPYTERVDRRREEEMLAEKMRQQELMAQRMRDEEEKRLESRRQHDVIVAAKPRYYSPTPAQRYKTSRASAIREINRPSKSKAVTGQVYVVKKGDNFYNVSKRYGVSRSNIASWNNISPNGNLKRGQRLVIKGGAQQVASASSSRLIRYSVKKGDTLMQLSRKFGVPLSDLRKANPQAGKGIRPGQSIKVVVDGRNAT